MVRQKTEYLACICSLVFTIFTTQVSAAPTGQELWEKILNGESPNTLEADTKSRVEEADDDAVAQTVYALLLERRLAGHAPDPGDPAPWEIWLNACAAYGAQPEAEAALILAYENAADLGQIEKFEKQREKLAKAKDIPNWLLARHRFLELSSLRTLGKFKDAKELVEKLGFVTDWSYLAPFDNAEKRGHNEVMKPERELNFAESYQGRNGAISWSEIPVRAAEGYNNLYELVRPQKESTTFLATTVQLEKATRAALHVGHAGAIKIWVNGILVLEVDRYHDPRPDQASCVAELRPGANLILAKVSVDEANVGGMFLRLVQADTGTAIAVNGSLEALRNIPQDRLQILSGSSPTFEVEPPSITSLAAQGPNRPPEHIGHVMYALLLDRLRTLDRDDISAYEIVSTIQTKYPECGLIARLAAEADLQGNRKRLGYRRAVELDPGDLRSRIRELIFARGRPFFERRRQWILDALDVTPQHPEFIAEYAVLLSEQNLAAPALIYAQQALETDPQDSGFLQHVITMSRDEYPIQVRERWLERLSLANRQHEWPLIEMMRLALQQDDLNKAERFQEKIEEIDTWNAEPCRVLARYHLGHGDYENAEKAIEAGLRISPHDTSLHRMEAERLDASGAEPEKILIHLQAVLRAEPSDPWALDYIEKVSPDTDDYYTPYRKDWTEIPEPSEDIIKDANAVTLLSQQVTRVHSNGNASQTHHTVTKVLTETGISQSSRWPIFYERGRDEIRVLMARVIQPDGTIVDAPAPVHRDTSNAGDAASRLYGDQYVAIIDMPSVQIGSIVEVEYQTEQRGENIFADYYGDVAFIGGFDPTLVYDYVLITPKDRDFYWKQIPPSYPKEAVDDSKTVIATEPIVTEEGDERIYRWEAQNLPRVPRDAGMPSMSEILPYIKISTFETWEDMTTWYWQLIEDQFIPDPTVRRQTEEVLAEYRTENGMSPEAKLSEAEIVSAINRFVNTEVRYLGLEFGIHGWKPHKVNDILQARYGDCKDKAALAVSMLELAGVKGNMALLRTVDRGEIDYELPSMWLFNHAIYYVPGLGDEGRFIDGTAQYYGASELPNMDAGANLLVIEKGGKSRLQRSPVPDADKNGAKYETTLALNTDGTVQGERHCSYLGLYNPLVRNIYNNKAKAAEIIESQLVSNYPGSRCLEIEISDLDTYNDDEWINYKFEMPNFASKDGNGRLNVPASLFPEDFSDRYTRDSSRHYDLVFNSNKWHKRNEVTINLPQGSRIPELPEPISLESEFGRFNWKAVIEGDTLRIEEEIALSKRRIGVDNYQAFREFCRQVDDAQDRRMYVEVSS